MYRFDLEPADAQRYRLLLMMNLFYLTDDEIAGLHAVLKDSNATVVWFYAPGFVAPDKLDLARMEKLAGFRFRILETPGPMLIRSDVAGRELVFGVKKEESPRFAVKDNGATALGVWHETQEIAFARKSYQGWHSVYVGAAPLPVEILRWLAQQAGADLWSTQPDIVIAAEDVAMIVATFEGERTLTLHKSLVGVENDELQRVHHLKMEMGDVRFFVTTG
ncbi:hypothetical protein DCC62_29295 [candidate division KSB1 bacterium]|nr:MAG: hypothetical protein DCC62_29295 [candidate division KSB1 bacterium]